MLATLGDAGGVFELWDYAISKPVAEAGSSGSMLLV